MPVAAWPSGRKNVDSLLFVPGTGDLTFELASQGSGQRISFPVSQIKGKMGGNTDLFQNPQPSGFSNRAVTGDPPQDDQDRHDVRTWLY
jgi:hypothetical protein